MAIMVLCGECCAKRKLHHAKDTPAKKNRCTACGEFKDCRPVDTTKKMVRVPLEVPKDLPPEEEGELVFPGAKGKKTNPKQALTKGAPLHVDASTLRVARTKALGDTVQGIMDSCLLAAKGGKSSYKSELVLEEAIEISVCEELRKRGVEISNTRNIEDASDKVTLTISW